MQFPNIFMVEFRWKRDQTDWDTGKVTTFIHRKRCFVMATNHEDAKDKARQIHERTQGQCWDNTPPDATFQIFGEGEMWSEPIVEDSADEG